MDHQILVLDRLVHAACDQFLRHDNVEDMDPTKLGIQSHRLNRFLEQISKLRDELGPTITCTNSDMLMLAENNIKMLEMRKTALDKELDQSSLAQNTTLVGNAVVQKEKKLHSRIKEHICNLQLDGAGSKIEAKDKPESTKQLRTNPHRTQTSQDPPAQGGRLRREHDDLADGLVKMAQILKRNNLAIQTMIKKDQTTLESTELAMSSNSARLRREGQNLKQLTFSSWKSFWRIFGMLSLLLLVFLCTYILIKFTSK